MLPNFLRCDSSFIIIVSIINSLSQEAPGRKHIAFDGWSSANIINFIGLMVYFILKGDLRAVLLDLIPIETGHTGKEIAEHIYPVLVTYGLESSVSVFFNES